MVDETSGETNEIAMKDTWRAPVIMSEQNAEVTEFDFHSFVFFLLLGWLVATDPAE